LHLKVLKDTVPGLLCFAAIGKEFNMNDISLNPDDRVLMLSATGFIGNRLLKALLEKNIKLRLL
jgi:hypothetical protein